MKRLQILFVCLMATMMSLSVLAQDAGMKFEHGTWTEVLAKAQKENKLIFVDAYTEWCGPCKWMAANVMTDPQVGGFFNTHFINYKVDMEKGEGPDLAKKYSVSFFPTLLFVNGNGEVVDKVIGVRRVADFLALGEAVKKGRPSITQLEAKFAAGDYDRKWLFDYLVRLSDARMKIEDPLAAFRPGMQGNQLLEKDNWEIFKRCFFRVDTEEFQYVVTHLDQFREAFGKEEADGKVGGCYTSALYRVIDDENWEEYEKLKAELMPLGLAGTEKTMAGFDLDRMRAELPFSEYVQKVAEYIESTPKDDAVLLNNYSWEFYEKVDDPKMLDLAVQWVERSVELEKDYANMDTYGFLLFKTGQEDKAVKVLKEAIEIAKANGEDYSATEKDMEKWLAK